MRTITPKEMEEDLTFSVRINVYGLAGEKYVPETTKTILSSQSSTRRED